MFERDFEWGLEWKGTYREEFKIIIWEWKIRNGTNHQWVVIKVDVLGRESQRTWKIRNVVRIRKRKRKSLVGSKTLVLGKKSWRVP